MGPAIELGSYFAACVILSVSQAILWHPVGIPGNQIAHLARLSDLLFFSSFLGVDGHHASSAARDHPGAAIAPPPINQELGRER